MGPRAGYSRALSNVEVMDPGHLRHCAEPFAPAEETGKHHTDGAKPRVRGLFRPLDAGKASNSNARRISRPSISRSRSRSGPATEP